MENDRQYKFKALFLIDIGIKNSIEKFGKLV